MSTGKLSLGKTGGAGTLTTTKTAGNVAGDLFVLADSTATTKGFVRLGNAQLKFPNTDGTSGQFLSTNGSGVLSFSTESTTLTSATVSVDSPNVASTTSTASPMTSVIPSMTLTPPAAGTYLIIFEGCFYYNFAGSTFPPTGPWIETAIFNNGTQVTGSLRRFEDTNYLPCTIVARVEYSTGAIQVRWRTTNSSNAANIEGRSISYIRLA